MTNNIDNKLENLSLERIPYHRPFNIHGDTYRSMDYKDSVYIIKESKDGVSVNFQFDGISCRQAVVQGYIYKSFKTKSKWFNQDWWYKKTCWSKDNTSIYFDTGAIKISFDSFLKESDSITDKATKLARPVENILKAIKKEVDSKTGLNIEFDFNNNEYGVSWFEAFIPIKIKGERYLLTWENCD